MDNWDQTEDGISESPNQPFEPKFTVKVSDARRKGETLLFTITTQTAGKSDTLVARDHEDFEFLHQCLRSDPHNSGAIIPPLITRHGFHNESTNDEFKKLTADVSTGEEFKKDCENLQKYLGYIVGHPTLGTSSILDSFLLEQEAPIHGSIGPGIFGKLSNAVKEVRNSNHKDVDEYFQAERNDANEFASKIKEFFTCLHKRTAAEKRLSSVHGHLATALTMKEASDELNSSPSNKYLMKLSETLKVAAGSLEASASLDEVILGSHIYLYVKYSEAVKEMLYRRTCLLIEYEEAQKTSAKAKPPKVTAAGEAELKAEEAFEKCSVLARKELDSYHGKRKADFREALVTYGQEKLKCASNTHQMLARILSSVQQMPDELV